MVKIKKILPAFLLALAMITTSACSFLGVGGNSVSFNLDGGVLESSFDTYTEGEEKTLPVPVKENYDFAGWYLNEQLRGEPVEKISATDSGDLSFWAKWTPKSFSIVYNNIEGATLSKQLDGYTFGTGVILPTAQKEGYDFKGWFDNAQFSGDAFSILTNTASGDKSFYAKWDGLSYKLELVLNGGILADAPTAYTYGVETVLPVPTKAGYNFDGWYESSAFSGDAVTKINADDKAGDRKFYANWTAKDGIAITAFGGYEEGAYVEFDKINGVSDYKVSYKASGENSYTQIDSMLVRASGTKIRADVVGIKKGVYDIKVEAGNKEGVKNGINVTAYDRSGYAHFDGAASDKIYAAGVGAYKNDGTPKSNAQIIYVSEATKNTVKATINGKSYTGIVAILGGTVNSKDPIIIRVLGQVAAATWKKDNVTYTKSSSTTVDGSANGNLKASVIKGKNGQQLPKTKDITQKTLIDGGYNVLDTSVYPELIGLNSKATYKASDKGSEYDEYDSAWNNCIIGSSSGGASNVTVEGIGTDAQLFQWGMTWINSNNIEIRNLTFDDYTEDACSFEGKNNIDIAGGETVDDFDSKRIWVHNCKFNEGVNYWDVCPEQDKHEGDGATDFKKCSYVTISYCHYENNHKTGLIGGDNNQQTANVTFHHNFYDSCKSRLPLARQANMHMFNNYYHNSGTSASLRANAYAFFENCYFDGSNNTMIDIQSLSSTQTKTYGVAKIFGCYMGGKGYSYQSMPSSEKPSDNEAHEPFINIVTDRNKKVESSNVFAKNFDTDSTVFYYADGKTQLADGFTLLTAEEVKTRIPVLAGVHKN